MATCKSRFFFQRLRDGNLINNITKIKSYNPDLTSDPFAEDGCLWFFNYFFYNRKLKRIVYLSCRCTSKSAESNYDDEDEEDMSSELMHGDESVSGGGYPGSGPTRTMIGLF